MVYVKDINKTTMKGQKTEATLTSKEAADTIAAQAEQATGPDCEAYPNEVGPVIVFRTSTATARTTPPFDIMHVTPVGGTFDGENTEAPPETRTVDGLSQTARPIDEAASHILNAAMHSIRQH